MVLKGLAYLLLALLVLRKTSCDCVKLVLHTV
jgi:hypothetical protein